LNPGVGAKLYYENITKIIINFDINK